MYTGNITENMAPGVRGRDIHKFRPHCLHGHEKMISFISPLLWRSTKSIMDNPTKRAVYHNGHCIQMRPKIKSVYELSLLPRAQQERCWLVVFLLGTIHVEISQHLHLLY